MRQRLKRAWSIYRHLAAVRSLLQWIGWWKYALIGTQSLLATGAAIYSRIAGWPLPVSIIVGLTSLAGLLFVSGLGLAFIRVGQATHFDREERLRNGPRILIEIVRCERGECIRFRNVRHETALNIRCEELSEKGVQLRLNPSAVPSIDPAESKECWAFVALKHTGGATEVIDLSNYLERHDIADLRLSVEFDDLNGVRFKCPFRLERSILGDVLCHPELCGVSGAP